MHWAWRSRIGDEKWPLSCGLGSNNGGCSSEGGSHIQNLGMTSSRHGFSRGVDVTQRPKGGHMGANHIKRWASVRVASEGELMETPLGQGSRHCRRRANQSMLGGCGSRGGDRKQTFGRVSSAAESGLDCEAGSVAQKSDRASGGSQQRRFQRSSQGACNWHGDPGQSTGDRSSPSNGKSWPTTKGRDR